MHARRHAVTQRTLGDDDAGFFPLDFAAFPLAALDEVLAAFGDLGWDRGCFGRGLFFGEPPALPFAATGSLRRCFFAACGGRRCCGCAGEEKRTRRGWRSVAVSE